MSARRPAWIAALACAAVLLALGAAAPTPAAAAKAAPFVALELDSNGGGDRLDVIARVRTALPKRFCTGSVRQAGRSARLPRLQTGPRGGAQWRWFMGDGAPRAKLTLSVSCRYPDSKVRRRVLVRTVGPGPRGRQVYRRVMQPGSLRKEKWNPPKDHDGSGGDEELYPFGQCTWWVARQRPDLPHFPGESGDAKNWIESARAYGWPTGTEPRLEAVAVFRPGQYGAGTYGHVAYVVAVNDKRMTITEANYHGQPIGSRRTIPWDNVRFIYKAAGTVRPSPGSPPRPPAPKTDMIGARASHTATLLPNGKVLVAGGRANGTDAVASAELYDPASNTWAPAPSMSSPRIFHTATLLGTGKVLVTGGQTALGGTAVASAELYDPASNTWAPAKSMSYPRMSHVATLLANGKVLITGGQFTIRGAAGNNVNLYDPASNNWTGLSAMKTARVFHTATLLANGKVLVTGGDPSGGGGASPAAELFDPLTLLWQPVPNMPAARVFHTATLLPNRLVLVVGGDFTGGGTATGIAEFYNPTSNTWVRLTKHMTSPRMFHTATLLANRQVLFAGGQATFGGSPTASAELFDTATNLWSAAPSLGLARVGHRTTLLPSGAVLVTGGDPTGNVFVTGGESSVTASATPTVEIYPGFGAK